MLITLIITAVVIYLRENDYVAKERDRYARITVVRQANGALFRGILKFQIIPLTYAEARESGFTLSDTRRALASRK